jgi:hypothetical protein
VNGKNVQNSDHSIWNGRDSKGRIDKKAMAEIKFKEIYIENSGDSSDFARWTAKRIEQIRDTQSIFAIHEFEIA